MLEMSQHAVASNKLDSGNSFVYGLIICIKQLKGSEEIFQSTLLFADLANPEVACLTVLPINYFIQSLGHDVPKCHCLNCKTLDKVTKDTLHVTLLSH